MTDSTDSCKKNNSNESDNTNINAALELLNLHYHSFTQALSYANITKQPVPSDTRAWSQILVSLLTGVPGLERNKGADLESGSDVKAACVWEAIDTPRFNGVIKAGTQSSLSGKLEYLDNVPRLFLVMWDTNPDNGNKRCRIWCVRPQSDPEFREMAKGWYDARDKGIIRSDNFQLHPPRNSNSNVIRNTFGNLEYPLLFTAEVIDDNYKLILFDINILENGLSKNT